jgi:hypothetical protein
MLGIDGMNRMQARTSVLAQHTHSRLSERGVARLPRPTLQHPMMI